MLLLLHQRCFWLLEVYRYYPVYANQRHPRQRHKLLMFFRFCPTSPWWSEYDQDYHCTDPLVPGISLLVDADKLSEFQISSLRKSFQIWHGYINHTQQSTTNSKFGQFNNFGAPCLGEGFSCVIQQLIQKKMRPWFLIFAEQTLIARKLWVSPG
jgi:hypothetical protein